MRALRRLPALAALVLLGGLGWQATGDRPLARVHRLASVELAGIRSADPAQVPPLLIQAVVAGDDPAFHERAVILSPIVAGLARMIQAGAAAGARHTNHLETLYLATRIGLAVDRDRILAAYMDRAYFGAGCTSATAAGPGLFATPLPRASDAELLALAALIQAPTRLVADPAARAERTAWIVARLEAAGHLPPAEIDRLRKLPPATLAPDAGCR